MKSIMFSSSKKTGWWLMSSRMQAGAKFFSSGLDSAEGSDSLLKASWNGSVLLRFPVWHFPKGYPSEVTYCQCQELLSNHIHIDMSSVILCLLPPFLPSFSQWQTGTFALLQNVSAQVCNWKAMTVIYFTSNAAALFWTILCHATVQSTRPHIVVLKDARVTIWKFGVVISYKFRCLSVSLSFSVHPAPPPTTYPHPGSSVSLTFDGNIWTTIVQSTFKL